MNNKCICNTPSQVNLGSGCVDRIIGCESHAYNGAALICTECYVERNFTLNEYFRCACPLFPYQVAEDVNLTGEYWCNYVCGDGYVGPGEPCDD